MLVRIVPVEDGKCWEIYPHSKQHLDNSIGFLRGDDKNWQLLLYYVALGQPKYGT